MRSIALPGPQLLRHRDHVDQRSAAQGGDLHSGTRIPDETATQARRNRYSEVDKTATPLARIGAVELGRDPTLAGRYLESFVAAQLRPECDRLGAVLHHLRTKGGEQEIDLLIELEHGVVAIEVKAGVRPRPADARHLVWLREQLGERVLVSIVLHRGDATFQLVDGVWAIPISSLWSGHASIG